YLSLHDALPILIIVTPSVGPASYYYDSPMLDSVRYETYIINELIPHIDKSYRTFARKESRAITGLSMGGHGAMLLSAKHPELFIAAGSMSGVMKDRKSTRLNSSHVKISYAVFCLKKK